MGLYPMNVRIKAMSNWNDPIHPGEILADELKERQEECNIEH